MTTGEGNRDRHRYRTRLIWDGNRGTGTDRYDGYGRDYRIQVTGKPELAGSAHRAFRGNPELHDPEDLFLASLAACHMLTYLALCARRRLPVLSYEDRATGTLQVDADGGGRFAEVRLNPVVVIAAWADRDLARRLHQTAHEQCFLANSTSVAIRVRPVVSGGRSR